MPILRETPIRASPTTTADVTIVARCEILEEIKPDPKSEMKYPTDIIKKNDPACAWAIPRSASTVGIRGAKVILDMKLSKKIAAKKSRFLNSDRNPNPVSTQSKNRLYCKRIIGPLPHNYDDNIIKKFHLFCC